MTDEELVAEYLKDDSKYLIEDAEGNLINITKKVREAFLAGRPKWHKVADGDLPKDENDVLIYSGEDWRMCVGRYSPKYKAWETGCYTIAWCDIPKYTEE